MDAGIDREATRLSALRALNVLDTKAEPSFDDIARLASLYCRTPIALVSLVDSNRQWFKARVGFSQSETDLSCSICRLVVGAGDMVVIPDLAADPRTRDNPLVNSGAAIRFYAGAPLTTADGHVLGALCVIDHTARPDGLTAEQREALGLLSARAVDTLELRRVAGEHAGALAARDHADEHRRAVELRWQHLFENLHEGFILGRVIRDANGRAADWRYEQVNVAWTRLLGAEAEPVVGRTIREVFPGIEEEWISEPVSVAETGIPIRFTRQVGILNRWYDGVIQPAGPEHFTILFFEVTDRMQAATRQSALLELGDNLRDCRTIADMTRTAAKIVGRTLGASRAGYGRVDTDIEAVEIEPDWTADGVASIAGRHRFRDFGEIRTDLLQGEPLIIADVRSDPRTADNPAAMLSLSIGALINMPVRERGRTVGVFIVHTPGPREWEEAELAFVRNVADRLEAGIARLKAEAQQDVINREISHRLKNSLAIVQAIAHQTLKDIADRESVEKFQRRLQTLATAQDSLLGPRHAAVGLAELIERVLSTAGIADHYTAEGPPVMLGAKAALSASLLMHELATNALKYGALSKNGEVSILWRVEDGHSPELVLDWSEHDGPPAAQPLKKGFGTLLLKMGLIGAGGADFRYTPEGFRATFRASMERLGDS